MSPPFWAKGKHPIRFQGFRKWKQPIGTACLMWAIGPGSCGLGPACGVVIALESYVRGDGLFSRVERSHTEEASGSGRVGHDRWAPRALIAFDALSRCLDIWQALQVNVCIFDLPTVRSLVFFSWNYNCISASVFAYFANNFTFIKWKACDNLCY